MVFLVQRSVGWAALRLSVILGGVSASVMAAAFVLVNHTAFGFDMPPVPCMGYGVVATKVAAQEKCVGEIISFVYSGLLVVAYVLTFFWVSRPACLPSCLPARLPACLLACWS